MADAAVLHGKDIEDPASLVENVITSIELHLVSAEKVSVASNELAKYQVAPLPQTMKIHQVMNDSPNSVHHRVLSCNCSEPAMCMCYSKCVTEFQTDIDVSRWVKDDSVDSVEVTALCSDNREAYFSTVLNELHACVSYDQLRESCLKLDNCLYGSLSVLPLAAFTSRDRIASELIPDDVNATTASLTPMVVSADGDCLPHAGSVFAFGHQNGADEIRARLVIELALHEDNYLDGSFLRQGTLFDDKAADRCSTSYAMYSDHYDPSVNTSLTPANVADI